MAWSVPMTWTAGMVPGATEFNREFRDNLNALKTPAFFQMISAGAITAATTATTSVPIGTALSATLTTYGGNVEVYFAAVISATQVVRVGFDYDGTALYTSGFTRIPVAREEMVHVHAWVTGLASGAHTFTPTWLAAGAGHTAILSWVTNPVVLWAREG